MREILIVDDDPRLRDVLRFAFERDGYAVREADDGAAALVAIDEAAVDLIVLDIMMPEMDGLEVCRRLRQAGNDTPVLFLSARDDEVDRVVGLELGADDYVVKPFSPRELVARVGAILRRSARTARDAPSETVLVVGSLRLDPSRHLATWAGTPLDLTRREFGLLEMLARRPGQILGRDRLMDGVYGDAIHVSDRTIDSHIRYLRARLREAGAEPIRTVRGLGYTFDADG